MINANGTTFGWKSDGRMLLFLMYLFIMLSVCMWILASYPQMIWTGHISTVYWLVTRLDSAQLTESHRSVSSLRFYRHPLWSPQPISSFFALHVKPTLLSVMFLQCCTGTLDYIQKRCSEALENLHSDPEKNTKTLISLLPSILQRIEDIHNEVCMRTQVLKQWKTKSQMHVLGRNRWGCSEVF